MVPKEGSPESCMEVMEAWTEAKLAAALAQRDAEVARLRGLLSGLVRIVEAMRHSTGLGKNQIERLEAAKTALAEAPRHE